MDFYRKDDSFLAFETFRKYYLPNAILERLEARLCTEFELDRWYQHMIDKDENESKTGTIEIAKPKLSSLDNVAEKVKSFYESEEFKIIPSGCKDVFNVKRRNEEYRVYLVEKEISYCIQIMPNTLIS